MPFQLQYGVRTINPTYVHEWAGPYSGVDETTAKALANATIPSPVRLQGLEVVLIWGGVPYKYWYKNGIADGDLVPMVTGSALEVQDEGTPVVNPTDTINFIGSAVTVTNPSPGQANVTINAPGTCDHYTVDIAESTFRIDNLTYTNSSSILRMYSGGTTWVSDIWNNSVQSCDNFGNIINIDKPGNSVRFAIPLSTDLYVGDTIKFCGVVGEEQWFNGSFIVYTVSYFKCSDITSDTITSISPTTLISPTIVYLTHSTASDQGGACFESEVILGQDFLACDTYFIIGISGGNPTNSNTTEYVTFSLSATKYCSSTPQPPVYNLRIRSCCDLSYVEVIADNGTPIGGSFLDGEGNCFSVIALTTDPITGSRTVNASYLDCDACLIDNPCPSNLQIEPCCFPGSFIFTSALPGVNIGDSFVDTDGNCWKAVLTTSSPTTGTVYVDTLYPSDDCSACVSANECPTYVLLESCCNLGSGYTSLQDLGGGAYYPCTFVDQFGFCWTIPYIVPGGTPIIPNLGFLNCISVTAPNLDCSSCTCPSSDIYYTLKNCCDGSLEVALLSPSYGVGRVLAIIAQEKAGCFEIISWSTTGTSTLTSLTVNAVYNPGDCQNCLTSPIRKENYFAYCPQKQCCDGEPGTTSGYCRTYMNSSGGDRYITGWGCDGTWYYNYLVPDATSICLASEFYEQLGTPVDFCCFRITNDSTSQLLRLAECTVLCDGTIGPIDLDPLTSVCVRCFKIVDGYQNVPYTISEIGICVP